MPFVLDVSVGMCLLADVELGVPLLLGGESEDSTMGGV